MAEPTAINPQTGERVVYRGGQWMPADTPPAMPSTPQAPGIIRGAPAPPPKQDVPSGYRPNGAGGLEPIPGGPADKPSEADKAPSGYRFNTAGSLEPIPGGPADKKPAELSPEDKASVLEEARNKLGLIKSLDDRSRNGWFATGFGADTAAKIPATTAADVARDIGTVSNAGALQRIMEMSKANGGKNPLTPLSNADFQALSSSIANLDPSQSDEQFQRNLGVYRDIYKRAFLAAGGTQADIDAMFPPPPVAGIDDEEGLTGSVTDTGSGYDPEVTPPPSGGGNNGGLPGGGLLDLAQQGVTLGFADEAAGVGGYISGFLTGEDPQAAYIRERDAARGRVAAARREYPILGTAAEFLGGGAAARVATPVGNALGSVVRQGAALGGAAGYGYGEGAQGSVTNALAGVAGGAALGGAFYGAGRGISALANRSAGVSPSAEQLGVIQAGERQGVPVRQPDVRPELRNRMANVETTQAGGPMVREARAQDANLIEQRVGAIGGNGNASDPYALGTQAQEAGRRYITNTRAQANRLYETARKEAGNARVQPTEAIATIDQNIAELRAAGENSNAGQISYLEGLRQDLAGGPRVSSLPSPSQLNIPRTPTASEMAGLSRVESVPLSKVRSGQDKMDWRAGRSSEPLVAGFADMPVAVKLENGEYVVLDGHHRSVNAMNAGKSAEKMHVIDAKAYDPENMGRVPRASSSLSDDDLLAELGSVPSLSPASASQGGLSIESVQNLRTNMRGQLSERGLTGTDAERRVSQVIDAANRDLARELPQGASDALRAADTFYRERQTFINDTLNQIMGTRGNPLPAETAASRLVSMTKGGGNYRRFSAMWQQLEDTERADVAATVAESLGRKRNGEFSISTLVQSLDPSKGINPRTARLIFGDDGAAALSDLRLLAKTKTDVQASLNNSRTGTAVNAASGGLKNLLLSGLGFSTGGVGGAVVAPVAGRIIANLGEKRAARMLLNPDFTKWLKNAPNTTNPQVIDKYFTRLTKAVGAGARNPGVSSIAVNDNQAFITAVRDAFSRSPGAAAANDEQNRRREPPQQ